MAAEPVYGGLMPHPPIVVPEVGGDRLAECRATNRACRVFAERLVDHRPDRLLLISPHAPRRPRTFGIWGGAELAGDLRRFGAPGVSVRLPNDVALCEALQSTAGAGALSTWTVSPGEPLDHGAVVPLRFVTAAGWDGPTAVVSLPVAAAPRELAAFGSAVADALARLSGRAALIASGDMTHRAAWDGPCGFDPCGLEFDRVLTELEASGRPGQIAAIDPELRERAAEDAADSSMIVAAALEDRARRPEILSYEHPFGVGYLVAVFHDGGDDE